MGKIEVDRGVHRSDPGYPRVVKVPIQQLEDQHGSLFVRFMSDLIDDEMTRRWTGSSRSGEAAARR